MACAIAPSAQLSHTSICYSCLGTICLAIPIPICTVQWYCRNYNTFHLLLNRRIPESFLLLDLRSPLWDIYKVYFENTFILMSTNFILFVTFKNWKKLCMVGDSKIHGVSSHHYKITWNSDNVLPLKLFCIQEK